MLILLALIVAIFALDGVECSSVTARKSQTQVSQKAYPYGNAPVNCNCHCNLHHDLRVSEDIKELRARLEQLIALISKTSSPQPTSPTGIWKCIRLFRLRLLFRDL